MKNIKLGFTSNHSKTNSVSSYNYKVIMKYEIFEENDFSNI